MKKKLEADLISIAHRVLKIKRKSDIAELHKEAQLLYEKLSVLLFVEEHFGDITTNYTNAIRNTLSESLDDIGTPNDEQLNVNDNFNSSFSTSTNSKIISQEKVEPVAINSTPIPEIHDHIVLKENKKEEKSKSESLDNTAIIVKESNEDFSAMIEKFTNHTYKKPTAINSINSENKKESLEDVLRDIQPDPIFITAQEQEPVLNPIENIKIHEPEIPIKKEIQEQKDVIPIFQEVIETPPITIKKDPVPSNKLNKSIIFGLNDRIAFEKHLFNNNSEELNRAILILNAFSNYVDAKKYIDHLVKPSYNNWDGKNEYVDRFMEVIKNKFV